MVIAESTDNDRKKQYLVLGMSHTACIARAHQDRPELDNVAVINIGKIEAGEEPAIWPFEPDVVCLSIAGNKHNIMTLFEQPEPFTIAGKQLDDKSRTSIPLAVMKDAIAEKNRGTAKTFNKMHDEFPNAKFIYICAPPPISDTSTIRHLPEFFQKMSVNGYAPNKLRHAVYKLQSDWYEKLAEQNGAHFIPPPAEAVTEDGMLASEFCGGDPTHANRKYGDLVLNQILKQVV
ncbi:hypothetical protein BOO69_08415 [Sulfitobacter alexandrii]|uniref:SGNH/GDSL hydrolase family protein n=1 Tax=Sulfitobacter alexandrii TaxID=1917485 RepID=A0A1J0WH26_9RHOB|nr:hypothetical protein [Sulfitobacter alexandrii]APE43438.1 hypothetical protein BOO69_08415 [Sulfitobacter alexandrii]